MVKNRYFFYLFLVNALMNIVNYVPRGLINGRFGGSSMSILAAVPIGLLFIYLFVRIMNKFPGKGIPDIFHASFPRGVTIPMLLGHASLWFAAGLTTLVSFVEITLRYISMDVEPYMILLVFLVVVCLCMRINTESILYGLEVVLFINFPIVVYVLLKAVLNPQFSLDAVMEIITHSLHAPTYKGIATATFVFSGYINLAIFNKVFNKVHLRFLWLIGLTGFMVLVTTFLIPIAYQGTIGVDRHVFPWFSTADVLRTRNFIIERVLFMFYFTYLTLSLTSTIIHWHVALVLLKSMFISKKNKQPNSKLDWWILLIFVAVTFYAQSFDQYSLDRLGLMFLNIRFCAEVIMILTIFTAYKRRGKKA